MQKDKNAAMSLEEYINLNDKLLTTLGVFIGIVALTVDSPNWALGVVSFVSIGGVILIGYELMRKLDKNLHPSLQLWLFRYIFLWGGIAFIIYWLYKFRPAWDVMLWLPAMLVIFAFIVETFLPVIRRVPFFSHLFGIGVIKKAWYQKFIRVTLVTIAVFFSLFSGAWIAFGTNLILDTIKQSIH